MKLEKASQGGDEPALFGDQPGLTVTEMILVAGEGKIRALNILGEDPMLTDPDLNYVRKSLEGCEFIVLQEIFPSETSQFADVLLAGASFAEKEGAFANTDRRIQRVQTAVLSPGEAQPDWRFTASLARRMLAWEGCVPSGPQAAWDYASPAQILEEIAALTPSYAGVGPNRLDCGERLHCPAPGADHPGTPILIVRVRSRRVEMIASAIVTERVSPSLIFGNFHFPGRQNVNNLTITALDPIANLPEY